MLRKQNLKEKKKCLYGPEKRQVYHDLIKAWQDYYNLSKGQEPNKKRIRHYELAIRNLQNKLGIPHTMFSIFKLLALTFYKHNPELFKEDATDNSVEKGMIRTTAESRLPLDTRPNMVQEIIQSDCAMQKYIGDIRQQNLKLAADWTDGTQ